ncbi:MAG: hypothetical protein J6T01_06530 [Kiritimatiellae bacterium]|nr:hypothetical protein [Kiritimatiellia bacterium]
MDEKPAMKLKSVALASAAEGGVQIGSFTPSASYPGGLREVVDVAPLAAVSGKEALCFTFPSAQKDQSICELEDFRFIAASPSKQSASL